MLFCKCKTQILMAVCSIWVSVWGGGEVVKNVHAPMPPNRGNTVPYLPKLYGKPCTWWQEVNLELSFKTQSSVQFFWSFIFSFCMCFHLSSLPPPPLRDGGILILKSSNHSGEELFFIIWEGKPKIVFIFTSLVLKWHMQTVVWWWFHGENVS